MPESVCLLVFVLTWGVCEGVRVCVSYTLLSLCVCFFSLAVLSPLLLLLLLPLLPLAAIASSTFKLKIIKSNKAVNRAFQFEFSRLRRKLYTCAVLSAVLRVSLECSSARRSPAWQDPIHPTSQPSPEPQKRSPTSAIKALLRATRCSIWIVHR